MVADKPDLFKPYIMKGHAMGSDRPSSERAGGPGWTSPVHGLDKLTGGQFFFLVCLYSPLSAVPPMLHTKVHKFSENLRTTSKFYAPER